MTQIAPKECLFCNNIRCGILFDVAEVPKMDYSHIWQKSDDVSCKRTIHSRPAPDERSHKRKVHWKEKLLYGHRRIADLSSCPSECHGMTHLMMRTSVMTSRHLMMIRGGKLIHLRKNGQHAQRNHHKCVENFYTTNCNRKPENLLCRMRFNHRHNSRNQS